MASACDVESLDQYYLLRVIYTTDAAQDTSEYYLYEVDGEFYCQQTDSDLSANIKPELYHRIEALF